jgi:hypothetical protein
MYNFLLTVTALFGVILFLYYDSEGKTFLFDELLDVDPIESPFDDYIP